MYAMGRSAVATSPFTSLPGALRHPSGVTVGVEVDGGTGVRVGATAAVRRRNRPKVQKEAKG